MPATPSSDYITKTEAAQLYRRSERSISRDITSAVKFRDQRVLQHIELRLEDGTRRPGSNLTIEEIVELRDRGLNPTWMIDTTWLKSAYGSRDETEVNIPHVPEVAHVPGLPENPEQQVAVLAAENAALRQANSDLRNQAGRLEKELDRRAEERREENELQKQNNVLMQQIYTLLSRTGSGLLPSQRASENLPGQLATVDANTSADQEGTESASPNPRRTKTVQKQPTPKARPTRASNQPSSKSNSQTTLQRWFPTLLGAGRRQKK